jgi:hypothetical protein
MPIGYWQLLWPLVIGYLPLVMVIGYWPLALVIEY